MGARGARRRNCSQRSATALQQGAAVSIHPYNGYRGGGCAVDRAARQWRPARRDAARPGCRSTMDDGSPRAAESGVDVPGLWFLAVRQGVSGLASLTLDKVRERTTKLTA